MALPRLIPLTCLFMLTTLQAWALDLSVGEDLAVNASPDVTFHVELSHRF
jgi:hypothetical protein